jgi:lysophospholipase L1-like esterase
MNFNEKTTILFAFLAAVLFIITVTFGILIIYQQQQINLIESKSRLVATPVNPDMISYADIRIARLEARVDEMVYPKIDYYAYGDSLTDPSDNYLIQMESEFAPGAVALSSTDGGGKSSKWGADYVNVHFRNNTDIFVYMFTNDAQIGLSSDQSIENYLKIHDYVTSRGAIAVPCIPILSQRNWSLAYTLQNQSAWYHALESAFDRRGIFYVKMYDALDSQPNNGRLDDINLTDISDGVHPDPEGHRKMGKYLWVRLSERYGPPV